MAGTMDGTTMDGTTMDGTTTDGTTTDGTIDGDLGKLLFINIIDLMGLKFCNCCSLRYFWLSFRSTAYQLQ